MYPKNFTIRSTILFSVLFFISAAVHAQSFDEGIDYVSLPGEAVIQTDGRVQVIEFFWFGCPSCFKFEPHLLNWLKTKPEHINFVNVPAVMSESWEFHAHAYYAIELLNLKEQLMGQFYDELHVEKNQIRTVEQFREWANRQDGVDSEKLARTLTSFAANTKVSQAALFANNYGISGVPSLIVGGKYRTSPSMAGSEERALQIVEFLANKILTKAPAAN